MKFFTIFLKNSFLLEKEITIHFVVKTRLTRIILFILYLLLHLKIGVEHK